MKKRKQPYGRIHGIKLPRSSKTPSLDDSKLCKKSPSVFNYYLSNEKIVNSCMSEASVAILFTYKWLHNSGKALDEIEKKANCFDSFCWQFGTTKPPYTT